MRPVPSIELTSGRLRRAVPADLPAIAEVMAASARELSRGFYSEAQIPSVVAHIAVIDPLLVEDETYFVIDGESEGEIDGGFGSSQLGATGARLLACGGWSWRDKLFTGVGAAAGGTGRLVPGKDPARVRAMFVHPKAARRGLGQAILEASERDARSQGFLSAELMSTAPGEPLYAARGYQVLERVTLQLPDGCEVPAARMGKSLDAGG